MKKQKEKYAQDRGQGHDARRTMVEEYVEEDAELDQDNESNEYFTHYSVDFCTPSSNTNFHFCQEIVSCR